jgi:cold shock protein
MPHNGNGRDGRGKNQKREKSAFRLGKSFDVAGTVKWFDFDRGFGFVKPDDDYPDLYLSLEVVEKFGAKEVRGDANVYCVAQETRPGKYSVSRILELDGKRAPDFGGEEEVSIPATLKFYNGDKGFGFLAPTQGGKDIFIHASKLGDNSIDTDELEEGQSFLVTKVDHSSWKGPQAIEMEHLPS